MPKQSLKHSEGHQKCDQAATVGGQQESERCGTVLTTILVLKRPQVATKERFRRLIEDETKQPLLSEANWRKWDQIVPNVCCVQ